jgi:hypothetical protein
MLDDSELVLYKSADGSIQSGGFPIRFPEGNHVMNGGGGGGGWVFPAGLYVSFPGVSRDSDGIVLRDSDDYRMEVPIFHQELEDEIYDKLYHNIHFDSRPAPKQKKIKTVKRPPRLRK